MALEGTWLLQTISLRTLSLTRIVLVASCGSVHGGGGHSRVCAERSGGTRDGSRFGSPLQVTFADCLDVFSIDMWVRRQGVPCSER